jgi:ribosomal protein L16 Arg81 hydroxylase
LLHFDTDDSFLMMTDGRKRCLLFAPDQTSSMYPYPVLDLKAIREGRILDSRVNAADPDLSRHPHIRNAKGLYGEIQAGEALFIPAGYCHYIESSDSMSLSTTFGKTPPRVDGFGVLCATIS